MTEAAEGKCSTTPSTKVHSADALPLILDHVCCSGDEKKLTEQNGHVHHVALRFLSNHFGDCEAPRAL
jgi:hypothetical protein